MLWSLALSEPLGTLEADPGDAVPGPGALEALLGTLGATGRGRRPGGRDRPAPDAGGGRGRADPTGVSVTTAGVREPPVPTKPPRRRDGGSGQRFPPGARETEFETGFRETGRSDTN